MSPLRSRPTIYNNQQDVAFKLDGSKIELIIFPQMSSFVFIQYLSYDDSYLPSLEILGPSSLNPTVFPRVLLSSELCLL